MARKWTAPQGSAPEGADVLNQSGQVPAGNDTEQLWKQLTSQRDSALILSPELKEWLESSPQFEN